MERTRLERRLEKLINLHFPRPGSVKEKEKEKSEGGKEAGTMNGSGRPNTQNRRASTFFDFDSLRGKSASDLWKNVLQTQTANPKNDTRCEYIILL